VKYIYIYIHTHTYKLYTCFVLWIKYYIISLTLQSTVATAAAAVTVAACTSLSDADGDKREKRYFRSDSIQMECTHADRIHHNGHVNAYRYLYIYIYTYLYSYIPLSTMTKNALTYPVGIDMYMNIIYIYILTHMYYITRTHAAQYILYYYYYYV